MLHSRISEDMSTEPPSARWLVRELIDRARIRSKAAAITSDIAFDACEYTYRDLARELGTTSAQALVSRARAQAGMAHPALLEVQFYQMRNTGAPFTPVKRNSDCTATADEFEALLEALLALLGRFVGMDIVVRLLASQAPHDTTPNSGGR